MPKPVAVAKHIAADLRARADPAVAAQTRRFFKSDARIVSIGVATPDVRTVVRDRMRPVERGWGLAEAVAASEELLRRRELEARTAGILLLARFERHYTSELVASIEHWIDVGYVADWGTTDGLCTYVVSPLLVRCADLRPVVAGWHASTVHWRRRVAVVSLVPFARRGDELDRAYGVLERLLDDAEDLMHKASGWLLREAGRTDRPRLRRFLLRHGPRIPRTTLRYAIEHFPTEQREELMRRTRSAPSGLGRRKRR